MARKELSGPAKAKVRSLATALDEDDAQMINHIWERLTMMFGKGLPDYYGCIKKLLTKKQAERLERMTSFTI